MKLRCVSLGWVLAMMLFGGIVTSVWAAPKLPKARITAQPVSQSVDVGAGVTFSVSVTSASTPSYQWRLNRTPIPGATEATYTINPVVPANAGKYDVVVTNAAGVVGSKAAALTVMIAPASLPVGAAIYGKLTYKILGQSETSNGSYVVTGAGTVTDPETPGSSYTFTYKRLSGTRATFTVAGAEYDADLGDYITINETHTLTFTGVNGSGERLAQSTSKGTARPPAGYKPSKISFSSKGTLSVDLDGSSLPGGVPPASNNSSGGSVIVSPSS